MTEQVEVTDLEFLPRMIEGLAELLFDVVRRSTELIKDYGDQRYAALPEADKENFRLSARTTFVLMGFLSMGGHGLKKKIDEKGEVDIYVDGASKGNPGPAGVGFIIENSEGLSLGFGEKSIGTATNNEAEYQAVIFALEKAKELGLKKICLISDSNLVVNQLKGEWKVGSKLLPLNQKVKNLLNAFEYDIKWVRSELNIADPLAKAAIQT